MTGRDKVVPTMRDLGSGKLKGNIVFIQSKCREAALKSYRRQSQNCEGSLMSTTYINRGRDEEPKAYAEVCETCD
jgi:hypothetical protein